MSLTDILPHTVCHNNLAQEVFRLIHVAEQKFIVDFMDIKNGKKYR